MLPPSLTNQLSKLVQQKRIQQLWEERWIWAKNNIRLEGTRGVERPRTGTNSHQSVSQTFSNNKHNFHIKFPEQAVHAQESVNRRSTQIFNNSRSRRLSIVIKANQEPTNESSYFVRSATITIWVRFFDRIICKKISWACKSFCTLVHFNSTTGRYGRTSDMNAMPGYVCKFTLMFAQVV
jgi:hypothetical protein